MAGERPRIFVEKHKGTLTSEQRAGFVLVFFTSLCALVLGTVYTIHLLRKPFNVSYEGPLLLSPSEQRALEVEKQKTLDTDGDTLSDYDELYVYRLSPYLRDTDGDGIDDASEVEANTIGGVSVSQGSVATGDEFLNTFGDIFGSGFYVEGQGVDSINQAVSGGTAADLSQVTPEFLREALKAQGATDEQLRYVTDQQLIQRYLELLQQYQNQQALESDS